MKPDGARPFTYTWTEDYGDGDVEAWTLAMRRASTAAITKLAALEELEDAELPGLEQVQAVMGAFEPLVRYVERDGERVTIGDVPFERLEEAIAAHPSFQRERAPAAAADAD